MKILLISHFFPPRRIGGAEKITQVYAASLQARGHQVQVLCAGDWAEGAHHYNGCTDEIYQGIAVRRVNFNWMKAQDPNRSLYDNPLVEKQLENWLDDWKPDLVHIVSLMTLSASVVRAAKKRGIPVVFTLVDFWLVCPKVTLVRGDQSLCDGKVSPQDCLKCLLWNSSAYQGLRRILPEEIMAPVFQAASKQARISKMRGMRGMALNMDERRRVLAETIALVDCIIAPSGFLGNVIDGAGILSKPVARIAYGHDLSWVSGMPAKRTGDCMRIGFIGQIIPLKGLHVLISAFQAAASKQHAELLIYGDIHSSPAYTDQLKRLAGGNENIRFMGAYAHDQIGEVLSQMDLIVVPSQWHENNPLVVQEAFASRTPVIGSNVGGISEFIQHGVNGLLFAYNSVDDLSAQIKRVLAEPGLIRQLESGIRPVKTSTAEIDEIEAIYHGLFPQAKSAD